MKSLWTDSFKVALCRTILWTSKFLCFARWIRGSFGFSWWPWSIYQSVRTFPWQVPHRSRTRCKLRNLLTLFVWTNPYNHCNDTKKSGTFLFRLTRNLVNFRVWRVGVGNSPPLIRLYMMGMIAIYATEININQTDSGSKKLASTRISLLVSHSIFCAGRGQEGVEKEWTTSAGFFLPPPQMWFKCLPKILGERF